VKHGSGPERLGWAKLSKGKVIKRRRKNYPISNSLQKFGSSIEDGSNGENSY